MKRKTLIVVDVQNEFCHPNGFFAKNLCDCNPAGFFEESKLTHKAIDETVDNIEKAIVYFREAKLPVVYVKAGCDRYFLSESRFERYKNMYERGFLKDGTWSTDFYRILPNSNELIFKKGAYNPFQNSDFKKHVLKTASSLVLVGFFSDVCIDAIARAADEIDVGIPTEVIANCSNSLLRSHNENLRFMQMFYGTKIYFTVEDYISNNNMNSI